MLFNHLLLQQVNVVQRHAGGWMHSFMPQPTLPGMLRYAAHVLRAVVTMLCYQHNAGILLDAAIPVASTLPLARGLLCEATLPTVTYTQKHIKS